MGYAGGGIPSYWIDVTTFSSAAPEFVSGLNAPPALLRPRSSSSYRAPTFKPYSHWPDTIFCWVELLLLSVLGGLLWM